MNAKDASAQYEAWLKKRVNPVEAIWTEQLEEKHKKMVMRKKKKEEETVFPFLRATFYRWAELWPQECPELAGATDDEVLAIGDLHVENFGTWRDAQARLIWGVNDFDEACPLPFTHDLVRLATSAGIAADDAHLETGKKAACEAILTGYAEALAVGGSPFVLDSDHATIRDIVSKALQADQAGNFWEELADEDDYPLAGQNWPLPAAVKKLLADSLPKDAGDAKYRLVRKAKGLGSLGRPRYLVVAQWNGGEVGREIKRLVPSAVEWLANPDSTKMYGAKLLQGASATRAEDPAYEILPDWVVRAVTPDAAKVELKQFSGAIDQAKSTETLLQAMGWEIANIHLGSLSAKKLQTRLAALAQADDEWLHTAAKAMRQATEADWNDYRA